jgi:diacylglycerol kinase (ATP)
LEKDNRKVNLITIILICSFLEKHNHHVRLIMAGGDGSLMTLVNKAKEAGCDLQTLVCCVLPYGTGNDLSRSLNWGGTEGDLKIYKSLPRLVHEICLNADEKFLNVWTVIVKYRANGTTLEIDSKTKQYVPRNETFFEKFMINYFSIGEDARAGTGFEKKRTKYRCCNNSIYVALGVCNLICGFCCNRRPALISQQIDYVRTLKNANKTTAPLMNPLILEETKESLNPLLPGGISQGEILFTTNKKDPNHMHIHDDSICYVALNIPSYMGGRANPWHQAGEKVGLRNPY